jgi:hypothetical protein
VARFDPLDPEAVPPAMAISPVQVSLCKKALKLLEKKLKHPDALTKKFWSLPVRNILHPLSSTLIVPRNRLPRQTVG